MTHPAPGSGGQRQPEFISLLLTEMGVRIGLLVLAMVLSFAGAAIGGGLAGALAGLAVGLVVYALVLRRFNARPKPTPPARPSTP